MSTRKIRPTLKPGDVCAFSKSYFKRNSGFSHKHIQLKKAQRMVVVEIMSNAHSMSSDSSQRYCVIKCIVGGKRNNKSFLASFNRRDLWFTGYNTQTGLKNKNPRSTNKSRPDTKPCTCPLEVVLGSGCGCGAIKPYSFSY